ncbi:unnamed protein product [Adineta ricciae]|uniref:Reverse transcriptase domain-containing protein n=1 Tax=Adineta ricciae TaxID=249248 RepID=A0A815R2Q5_ADIRI|nr:unnamed protein product [Adineta ricciae]CAF1476353.1 unnamed protein product [Adineta ricciae]
MNDIPPHTEHGLFADDTALWTTSNTLTSLTQRLQQSIDAFESWCKSWKLKLHPTKTEMIHFRLHSRKKYKHPVEVKVENTIIKPLDATRYLGVIIDKQLKWRNHLQHLETKMAGRISLLRYLAKSVQEPNQKTMINIFKAVARSVVTYGYPVVLTANDKVWDRLQIIQNKALRATLGLPIHTSIECVHRITKIPKINDYETSLLQQSIATATSNKDHTRLQHLQNIADQL